MTKQARKYYRYSFCFKQKVEEEIKQGESLYAVSRKYGIGGSNTVRNWVKQWLTSKTLCLKQTTFAVKK
jgi:transposase-like protein